MAGPARLWLAGHMCDARLWTNVRGGEGPLDLDGDLTQDDTIIAMAARALDQVDGPIIPIGFSMGAIVALMMAWLSPERIAGLVLASTNCTADLAERSAVRLSQQAQVRAGGLERVVKDELKPLYLAPCNRGNTDLLDLTLSMALDLGPEVFIRQSEALRTRPGQCEILDTWEKPVLIVSGADDTLCPPAWHEAMAARCATAQLVTLPATGHLTPLESPELFQLALHNWLTQHKEALHS
jgi:pimeloyl-ACP methyl ester carboxylesterase